MKNGAAVIVQFQDGYGLDRGILLEHSEDWRLVTIRTDRGGTMSGTLRHPTDIIEANLLK